MLRRVSQARAASLLLALLIAACAVAFLRAEQLKLEHSPVQRPKVKQSFSPTCDAADPRCHPTALLRFILGDRQEIGLTVVNANGDVVRHLPGDGRQHAKGLVRVRWDGRDDRGAVVPDGTYRLAVHLQNGDRTITVPDPIKVDTSPPTIDITRRDLSPRGLRLHFLASEPSRTYQRVTLGGKDVSQHPTRRGRSFFAFRGRPAGRYVVTIYAVDAAGNRTARPPSVQVTVP